MKLKQWKIYQYYAIIAVISLIALVFLPMVGSSVGLAWNLPNTIVGWVVYVMSKLLVATINILIFHCFVQQGKLNIRDNPLYLEANEIMLVISSDESLEPKSPQELIARLYRGKGITIFFTTLLAAVGLTQAVLTFDWITMGTYFVTIVLGIIFGIFTMNDVEIIWTEEYWKYAQRVKQTNADAILKLARAKEEEELRQKAEAEELLRKQEEEKRLAEERAKRAAAEEAFRKHQEAEFQKFLASYEAAPTELAPEPLPVCQD